MRILGFFIRILLRCLMHLLRVATCICLPRQLRSAAVSYDESLNHRVTFDWNGQTIDFCQWADDAYGLFDYTTRDRSAYFLFDLQPVGREVRIYIKQQPSYQGRPADFHSTHRLGSTSHPYVCVASHLQPTNVPDALSWAVYWAEETNRYIKTGRTFA